MPAPGASRDDGTIDVALAAERLGMPLVHDADAGVWALGPGTTTGRVLSTAIAARPHADRPRRRTVPPVVAARPQGAAGRLGQLLRLPREPARVAGVAR